MCELYVNHYQNFDIKRKPNSVEDITNSSSTNYQTNTTTKYLQEETDFYYKSLSNNKPTALNSPRMKLLLVLALVALAQGRVEESKIDPRILRQAKQEPTVACMLNFRETTEATLEMITDTRYDSREERLDAMHDALVNLANRVQARVKSYLLAQGFEFRAYWITNQIYIPKATLGLVLALGSMEETSSITQHEVVPLEAVISGPIIRNRQNPEGEWGIKMIQAQEAHALLRNTTTNVGEIRISTIDTGCRHTHEALRENWLGDYGWFDPYDGNLLPMDINGHGTHTTGTICGKGGIGVYPDAKWTSCRGCATSSCSQFALLDCAQFIACPTRPDGTTPDCKKAPHLVSNSWGGGRGQTWFDPAIAAFHAARIIPLFSIGNSGPSCNTANSPGDRAVIGVGSTTVDDGLSSFSSVGPTIDGRMKPDISAPGSDVISAYNTADNAYRSLSGTSMACPHAAGLTALLMAFDQDLEFSHVTSHMFRGVDKDRLVSSGRVCAEKPDNEFPNHHYGSGRINALTSLKGLIDSKK